MENPNIESNTKNKRIFLLTFNQQLGMNLCLILWAFVEWVFLSFPNLLNYLSFFDNFIFQGVHFRSLCTSGVPMTNARLLMCAWIISFVLTIYTAIKLLKERNFFRDFTSKAKELSNRVLIGRYAAVRFKYYYVIFGIFILIVFPYYYSMFTGDFLGSECDKFLVDRTLFIQGAIIVVTGFFLGLFGVLAYCSMKNRAT